jgi:hypothetical protein
MSNQDAKIRETAYRLWVELGRVEGHDLDFWYNAERWINQDHVCRKGKTENAVKFSRGGKTPAPKVTHKGSA